MKKSLNLRVIGSDGLYPPMKAQEVTHLGIFHGDGLDPCLLYNIMNLHP